MKALPTINILYEDDNFFAFSKPANLHSIGKTEDEPSAARMALEHHKACLNLGNTPFEHGLVNRLDFQSSGILLAAKTNISWNTLREVYSAKLVLKEYVILVENNFSSEAKVSNHVGSPNRRAPKVKVFDSKPSVKYRAKPAITIFKPLQSLPILNATLVNAHTKTGVRHQVRAHAAHIGHTLVGDEVYGSSRSLPDLLNDSSAPDFFLHASKVSFEDPWSSEERVITSSVPDYLKLALGLKV